MKTITVIGESKTSPKIYRLAQEVGRLIGQSGAVLICGGLSGVMEAAAKGAKSVGGLTVGILPTNSRKDANRYIDISIVTGMGFARNVVVVKSGQVVIAIGGKYGTLSEIAHALSLDIPVIALETWSLKRRGKTDRGMLIAKTARQAVKLALKIIGKQK